MPWGQKTNFPEIVAFQLTQECMSGEREYPCLVPDFRGDGFSFCPFSMM
jgi:hypothetical protein